VSGVKKQSAPFKVQWEKSLLRRSKLHLSALGVGVLLASYGNEDGTSIHPSQETLAEDLGVSARTVGKWLGALKDSGWIIEEFRGIPGAASRYRLAVPESVDLSEDRRVRSGVSRKQDRKDLSGVGRARREHRNDRAGRPERSCVKTGTIVQEDRNDPSAYQHKDQSTTNPLPTQGAPTDGGALAYDPWVEAEASTAAEEASRQAVLSGAFRL
jgi:DNA-binding transcriptional ArsR family regulator